MVQLKLARLAAGAAMTIFVLPPSFAQPSTDTRPLTLGLYVVVPCEADSASEPMQADGTSVPYCLERSPIIDQTDVVSAAIDKKTQHRPLMELTLHDAAAQQLHKVTAERIGLQMAVVLDGRLISVATIAAPMRNALISGLTEKEAISFVERFARGVVAKARLSALPSANSQPGQPDYQRVFSVGNGVSAPVVIRKQEPEYTAAARAAGIQGTVVLAVVIRPDGTADTIRVVRSLDPGLDAKAIECARSFRFRPAQKDGQPVAVRATLEINFRL